MDLLAELVALVAPPVCAGCGGDAGDVSAPLCPECRRQLPWLREVCPRCGLPGHDRRSCRAGGRALTRAWAPLAYEGVARELMRALKFRGHLPVANFMAAQMSANLPPDLRRPGATVVPVPAHPQRRRSRGHDPAARLARGLAERTGLPYRECLRRTDRSAPQVGASRARRLGPSRLAVMAVDEVPQRVLLVDDVHTTGATLTTCASALRAAGAAWVAAVTYARAL